jgi:hypothetical protein
MIASRPAMPVLPRVKESIEIESRNRVVGPKFRDAREVIVGLV